MPRLVSVLSVCVAVVLGAGCLWMLAGCGGSSSSDSEAKQDPVEARLISQGREIFGEKCQGCHAIEGRPRTFTTGEYGPSMDEVKPKGAFIAHMIDNGGGGMQSFADELTEVEKLAVKTYLLDVTGRHVPERSFGTPAQIAAGERAFRENCQGCHSIADYRSRRVYEWYGTHFDNVRISVERIQQMMDRGDWWMPGQYDKVPREVTDEIIAYIVATAGRGPDVYKAP
ncbi:cytochrome c [Conexibacter stalactiti]|uniref:Cytochrome c n=1 Tax=Conexibacter stalactiti TaxID=1940611 RepID=A0ABU4HJL9_9ACTN|nr:cytochrome c [Conexibacter stalactiti]MDW5593501.1 cytochrome c [Conexibacter stalactiti]MEC5034142.1 cytochrome c [Conexibacter stalactiti]